MSARPRARSASAIRRVLFAMLLGVVVYGGYAVYAGLGKMGDELARFHWWAFGAACSLAFGNYLVRWLKWEFYLTRLDIRGVRGVDSLLTFLSGFVLTVTPGKVGEVFKSLVLFEIYGVPVARTAPIVVAERVTDVIGVVVLIVLGSLGFSGGLVWAALGATAVFVLLVVVSHRRLSIRLIGLVERLPGPFRTHRAQAARGVRQPGHAGEARRTWSCRRCSPSAPGRWSAPRSGSSCTASGRTPGSGWRPSSTRRARWPARWSRSPAVWASPSPPCRGSSTSSGTCRPRRRPRR